MTKVKDLIKRHEALMGRKSFSNLAVTDMNPDIVSLIEDIQSICNTDDGSKLLLYGMGMVDRADSINLDKHVQKLKRKLKDDFVFISLSKQMVSKVESFVDFLESHDISTYIYDKKLNSGDDFTLEIMKHMNNAEVMISIVDVNYLNSDFAMSEFIYGFTANDVDHIIFVCDDVYNLDLKLTSVKYYDLFKFVMTKSQVTYLKDKSKVCNDLCNKLSLPKLMDSNLFSKVYDEMTSL